MRRNYCAGKPFGLLVALVLAAQPAIADGVLVIRNDRGGLVGQRVREINDLNNHATRVELRGDICYSACTLYLGVDDLCINPATIFGFHGPSRRGAPLPTAQFDHWSKVMADHYTPALRQWFWNEARFEINGYHRVTGQNLIALGYSPC